MCTKKNRTLYQLGDEKIAFPPKSDGRTDISNYKVASLLKYLCPMVIVPKTLKVWKYDAKKGFIL